MATQLPENLISQLDGVPGFDAGKFNEVHQSGEQVTSIRINPFKKFDVNKLPVEEKVPWNEHGYYLKKRPSFTFDPSFHAGAYYVQDASSMFLEFIINDHFGERPEIVALDLCAAPGGKSTLLASVISEKGLLVANEVIRQRCLVLMDNIVKWGSGNVVVTNNDPAHFSGLKNMFDLIVGDVPCSGSGLFRKDPDAIGEWSEANVNLCSKRQQRIMADILPSLKEGGMFIYSTCSYSMKEDEEIIEWLKKEFDLEPIYFPIQDSWGIVKSRKENDFLGYRMYPYNLKGEGFFVCPLIKKGERNHRDEKRFKPVKSLAEVPGKEIESLKKFISLSDEDAVYKKNDNYVLFPKERSAELQLIYKYLHVIYFGTELGKIINQKFIPAHALALSIKDLSNFSSIEVEHEESINFLKKQNIDWKGLAKGWTLVKFEGLGLGWINVLDGRINNYYPKELRILKEKEN